MKCQYCDVQLIGDETPLADGTYICSCNCPIYNEDNLYKLKITLDQIKIEQEQTRKEQDCVRREQERIRREQERVRREQEQFARYNNTGQLIFVNCQQCDHSFTRTICILCRPEE